LHALDFYTAGTIFISVLDANEHNCTDTLQPTMNWPNFKWSLTV